MRIRRRLAGRVAAAVTIAFAALPAAASAACPVAATTQPFAHVGDHNDYFLAPGGDFEQANVWTRTGDAAIVDTYGHGFDSGSRVVRLPQNASTSSPPICFDVDRPHLRFVARADSPTGTLRLDAIDEAGNKVLLAKLDAADYRSWRATPFIPLVAPLALVEGQARSARLRLTSLNGDWLADAVYIDPYKRG